MSHSGYALPNTAVSLSNIADEAFGTDHDTWDALSSHFPQLHRQAVAISAMDGDDPL